MTGRRGALAAGLMASALAGCRGATAALAKGDALQQDLDAAAASATFAPPIRGAAPLRVVSALELGASPDAHAAAPASTPTAPALRGATPTRALPRHTAAPIVRVRIRYIDAPETPAATSAAAPAPATGEAASAGNYSGSFTPGAQVAAAPARGDAAGGGTSNGGDHGGWGSSGGGVIPGGGRHHGMCGTRDRHRSGWPGEGGELRPPGQMIGGTLHGELGGRPSGTVAIPVGDIVRGAWRTPRLPE